MAMIRLFVAKIEWYSEYQDREQSSYYVFGETSYAAAAQKIVDEWGESAITSITLSMIGDDEDANGITISESMYDALVHDMPEDVICLKTEWRQKYEASKHD